MGRLPQGGSIHEIESKLPISAKRTDDEGMRLLRAVPSGAALAILDPRGKDHSSEDLAALTMEASAMAQVPLAGTQVTVGRPDLNRF